MYFVYVVKHTVAKNQEVALLSLPSCFILRKILLVISSSILFLFLSFLVFLLFFFSSFAYFQYKRSQDCNNEFCMCVRSVLVWTPGSLGWGWRGQTTFLHEKKCCAVSHGNTLPRLSIKLAHTHWHSRKKNTHTHTLIKNTQWFRLFFSQPVILSMSFSCGQMLHVFYSKCHILRNNSLPVCVCEQAFEKSTFDESSQLFFAGTGSWHSVQLLICCWVWVPLPCWWVWWVCNLLDLVWCKSLQFTFSSHSLQNKESFPLAFSCLSTRWWSFLAGFSVNHIIFLGTF